MVPTGDRRYACAPSDGTRPLSAKSESRSTQPTPAWFRRRQVRHGGHRLGSGWGGVNMLFVLPMGYP